MHDGIRTLHQRLKATGISKTALYQLDPLRQQLPGLSRGTHQGTHPVSGLQQFAADTPANETGGPGDGDGLRHV
jgi:hypothetical protein